MILTSVAGACCFDLDPQKLPCPKAEYHDAVEYAVSKAVSAICRKRTVRRKIGRSLLRTSWNLFPVRVIQSVIIYNIIIINMLKAFWIVKFGILMLPS